jgi:adenine-specific DNA-methyltransferase
MDGGGKSGTALYRIAGDLALTPAVFCDNQVTNTVLRADAQQAAESLADDEVTVAYLDPPYNQHPYGSNYHVLNSVVLWDKPPLTKNITGRTKSAIRMDWRTERRSAYNHASEASKAYRKLIQTLNAHYILTSYSTDGTIPLDKLLAANAERGHVSIEMKGYKRYRVSSTRFSEKPMNVEFVVILDTHRPSTSTADELKHLILSEEQSILDEHPETSNIATTQMELF